MKIGDTFNFEGWDVELTGVVKNEKYTLCVLKGLEDNVTKLRIYVGVNIENEKVMDLLLK